jgi:hypothetical protein
VVRSLLPQLCDLSALSLSMSILGGRRLVNCKRCNPDDAVDALGFGLICKSWSNEWEIFLPGPLGFVNRSLPCSESWNRLGIV